MTRGPCRGYTQGSLAAWRSKGEENEGSTAVEWGGTVLWSAAKVRAAQRVGL